MRKTICVDLDGVLAEYSGWKGVDVIGEPITGAVEFTRRLSEIADVVIFTTRCNPEVNKPEAVHLLVNRVRDWLDMHGFVYQEIYAGVGKPIASAYVDDNAIVCRPQHEIFGGCQGTTGNWWYQTAIQQAQELIRPPNHGPDGSGE